jgi:hypothetical protein
MTPRQETAALQDFERAYVSIGSKAALRHVASNVRFARKRTIRCYSITSSARARILGGTSGRGPEKSLG